MIIDCDILHVQLCNLHTVNPVLDFYFVCICFTLDIERKLRRSVMITRPTTKELIASSALEILESTDISKVTVKQIADNCGITTRAFYNHFKDKHDVASWIYLEHMRPHINCSLDEWNTHMSAFFNKHWQFFCNTMNYTGQNNLADTIVGLDHDKYCMHIKPEVKASPKSLNETIYSLDYMLHGNVGIFRSSLNGHPAVKTEDYVANYSDTWALISTWLPVVLRENLSMHPVVTASVPDSAAEA